jgi:large subunit ribosomal protein L2
MLKFYCKKVILKLTRYGIVSRSGRNFLGRICVKGRGNGNKRMYRFIDFYRRINQFGYVLKILYDCNRTSFIALVIYQNGLNSFIIATENLKINDFIYSGEIFFEINQKYVG